MINNRILTLVYRSILFTFCFVGIFLNSGISEGFFNTELFVYYTYITNILCLVVTGIVLYDNYKKVINNEHRGHNEIIRKIKGAATIGILITGVVYHFLLGDTSVEGYFHLDNIIVHYIVPLMFVLDWILFDKRKNINVIDPLTWLLLPATYLIYALIRGAIVGADAKLQYAYWFIDVNDLGYSGVLIWALILTLAFSIVGYLMWLFDKVVKIDGKIKLDFSKEEVN